MVCAVVRPTRFPLTFSRLLITGRAAESILLVLLSPHVVAGCLEFPYPTYIRTGTEYENVLNAVLDSPLSPLHHLDATMQISKLYISKLYGPIYNC